MGRYARGDIEHKFWFATQNQMLLIDLVLLENNHQSYTIALTKMNILIQ